MTTRNDTWSWKDDVAPFVVMLMITCLDMSLLTIVKAAMNDGLSSIVYIVYHDALGTLILLPFFIIHIFRNVGRPPLTLRLLFRFFILGLFGACLFQVAAFAGVYYSSPTMASAIFNLTPANTFLIAVLFRMEKIDIKSVSSGAKILGTIVTITGAMVFTLYQGPEIFHMISSLDSHNQLYLSQPSNWVFGGLILVISVILNSIWNVLQSATAIDYPDQQTIVFFYSLFGVVQCIVLSPFLEPNPSAWVVRPGIWTVAIVYGALHSTILRTIGLTWCLEKKGPVFVTMFMPFGIVISVLMGVSFLGDSLYLGSTIGAIIVSVEFYTVMWGQAEEKNKLLIVIEEDFNFADEPESSNDNTPLLSSINESAC
ncbi:WAT1-related protein At5g40240-like [Rutidosis leptorrhynchoides]|uniref:WAT1-related protein At5g40240-like n=1 Tax=Rutidosis leptorrhynchoides TaxID=125765 RepID=UPI003A99BA30